MKTLKLALKTSMLFVALAIAPGLAPAQTASSGQPGTRVRSFLNAYHSLKFSGLPTVEQERTLAPHLSPRLRELITAAREVQQEFIARNPDEKPPFVEGDLFSSLFEGPTSFTMGAAKVSSRQASVLVRFTYVDSRPGMKGTTWQDRYLLTKVNGRWLIDDVEYLGKWDFAPKGKLSEALAARE
jgi:hypothetical protein